jgi:hypothetical protein
VRCVKREKRCSTKSNENRKERGRERVKCEGEELTTRRSSDSADVRKSSHEDLKRFLREMVSTGVDHSGCSWSAWSCDDVFGCPSEQVSVDEWLDARALGE